MNPPPGLRTRIGIGNGWRWFTGALAIVRRFPAAFGLMALIPAVIYTLVPILGRLVLLVTGPALLAGITLAAHAAATGGKPSVRQLFALFQASPRRAEAIKLCVPLVIANVAAAIVLAVAATSLLVNQGVDLAALEGDPQKMMATLRATLLGGAMRGWWIAIASIIAFGWTFTALAIPRVALAHERAFPAMGASLRGVWGHLGAWIVAVVALLACLVALALVLQLTRLAVVVQLGVITAAYAVLGPLLYLAWRDLGGTPTTGDAVAPPPRPPAPPPGFLEA